MIDYSPEPNNARPIVYQTGGLGGVVTIANTLFAIVIITALIRNQTSAATAIVAGGIYYAATTHTALLILSGALTTIAQTRAEQRTQRRLYELQYTVRRLPADGLPALPDDAPQLNPPPNLPQLDTYVPARQQDDSVRRTAVAWLLQLFDQDGHLNPKKVILNTKKERPGRINVALPSDKAKQYLLDARIIYPMPHGYRYNLRYPTVADMRRALSNNTPVGG